MDLLSECEGWRNWPTWMVALTLDSYESYQNMIYEWVDGYAEDGLTKAEAISELAHDLRDLVREDYLEAWDRTESPIIQNLMFDPDMLTIDFGNIARYYVDDDYGRRTYAARRGSASKSNCAKKPATKKKPASKAKQSNNRKPRTTSSKKPVKSAPRRR